MEFLKNTLQIIIALSSVIGILITVEKFTKGKLIKWLVKPVVDPLQKQINQLEVNNNLCKTNITNEIKELKIEMLKQTIMNDNIPISERLEARR